MMKTVSQRILTASLLIGTIGLGTLGLGACGIKGELQTPPPLWGDKAPPAENTDKQKQESND